MDAATLAHVLWAKIVITNAACFVLGTIAGRIWRESSSKDTTH